MDEATRKVTVREGDNVTQLPAMQALLRTLIRSGAQGDIKAARQVLELIARAETARTALALEMLQKVVQYKEKFGRIFEQHERMGVAPPEIYPHPDDIIIGHDAEVTYDGPTTKEEAGARTALREHAMKSKDRYLRLAKKLDKDPTNRALRREYDDLNELYKIAAKETKRLNRHQSLREARRASKPKPPEPKKDDKEGQS